jgi:hypothetical protein
MDPESSKICFGTTARGRFPKAPQCFKPQNYIQAHAGNLFTFLVNLTFNISTQQQWFMSFPSSGIASASSSQALWCSPSCLPWPSAYGYSHA